MKIITLALIHLKRMVKDMKMLSVMLIMPLVVITGTYFIFAKGSDGSGVDVAFNIKDKGNYANILMEELNITKSVYYNDEDKALESLKNNDIVAVYVIPEDFTEKIKEGKKPIIEAYKREEGNGTFVIEGRLNEEINKIIKNRIFLKEGVIEEGQELSKSTITTVMEKEDKIDDELFYTVLLIINFIILSASSIGQEIILLKKEKILSRAISTANKGWEIIGSLYLAMFLLQIGIYTTVVLAEKFIIGYSFENLHIVLINILLVSLYSLSLGVLSTRIFENEGVASITITLVGITSTFFSLVGLGLHSDKTSWIINNLSKFTPQYWAFDSIMNGVIFPNSMIIILMSLVLFTAGNIKLNNFVNR
ncbi:ABC transporter permease [Clostridium sp. MSJ-11]|uniref:ABC transporter permease n=1 Tax=Clostridium mobile TaxID=2841512 RepID=A0ABS6EHP3_9CLOT|nr:ABC transporter permease [Clostridium mobile]MBU5484727.1 ABC transporter permease [Clostridium mobile]